MARQKNRAKSANRSLARVSMWLVGGFLALLVLSACDETALIPQEPGIILPTATHAALSVATATPEQVATVAPTAQAIPTAEPPQESTAIQPGATSAFGLAWFHKPPEDGTTVEQMAAAHSYIHLTGAADVPYRDDLKAAGYSGPIYSYVSALSVEGPGPYKNSAAKCDDSFEPHDNNVAWSKGDFCTYIHPNESWFLHNGNGDRLVLDYFGANIWTYLMNPDDPGWREFSYARMKQVRDDLGYDGIWLDNLDLDLQRGRGEMKNSDGHVAEFASDEAYRAAVRRWLGGLRDAVGDWPIWANLVAADYKADSFQPYADYLDGGMEESFAVRWIDGWLSAANWDAQLRRAENWLAQGKGLVMVGQGPQDDAERMRFTLASYMLVTQPGQAFFRYTRFDSYYNGLWLYPDYDTARQLGTPLGPRQEVSPGIWHRDFTHGYVEVDTNEYTGELVLR